MGVPSASTVTPILEVGDVLGEAQFPLIVQGRAVYHAPYLECLGPESRIVVFRKEIDAVSEFFIVFFYTDLHRVEVERPHTLVLVGKVDPAVLFDQCR